MDRKYRHLTLMDRTLIGFYKTKELNQTQIANLLGVNRSAICRELKRNHDAQYGYHILLAQDKAQKRQWVHRRKKIERSSIL